MTRIRPHGGVAIAALCVAASCLLSSGCGTTPLEAAKAPKVIILGFDGMDYELTKKLMTEGRLPNFERLARQGGFTPLGTAIPPQSPVAWSDFITGIDSGGHGIFDFIHRDPATMTPYLSTSTAKAGKTWVLGKWRIPNPFAPGEVQLLRHGEAFWTVLEEQGVETTIIRMPANFPPSGTASRELSGMGTPDILGTYGTFSFYTSNPFAPANAEVDGGEMYSVEIKNGRVDATLLGPDNPFRRDPEPAVAEFTAFVDRDSNSAKLVVGDHEFVLKAGEWSDWVPIEFDLVPSQVLPAIGLFYLRSVAPDFELYVSPLNIDPTSPAMPVSSPNSYAKHLCECTGYFYTQGMPEDTGAVTQDVLSLEEFLAQARIAGDENINQYHHILSEYEGGLLFHYFGNVDLVGHIVWRSMDPDHPAYDEARDAAYADVIPALYERMDSIVGYTMQQMPEDALLVVMSDHGFAPWRRAMHLNTWLAENGYLSLKDPERAGKNYSNVDWSKTRAYGLGLNGLYLNLEGREKNGIVAPADRDALIAEIGAKLLTVVDPATGQLAVSKVYPRESTYSDGGYRHIGPDLQVGYAETFRGSNESAIGEIRSEVFTDNTDRWSGDHCMDHESVPGILLTNRKLKRPGTELKNLAQAILAEYGIKEFPRQSHAH